jgi:hypothetical protein
MTGLGDETITETEELSRLIHIKDTPQEVRRYVAITNVFLTMPISDRERSFFQSCCTCEQAFTD